MITLNPTIDSAATTRLGILYPPTGSEFEYYTAAEAMRPPARAYVVGVRIAGGAREHEPRHLRQTASVDNLLLSARALAPVKPHSVMWACTSGSFIDGLDFARKQAAALARELGVPASSTSLAFLAALERFGIGRVAVLASYPRPAARAFAAFLAQGGVEVADMVSLGAPSGPDAARLGAARLVEAAGRLRIPRQGRAAGARHRDADPGRGERSREPSRPGGARRQPGHVVAGPAACRRTTAAGRPRTAVQRGDGLRQFRTQGVPCTKSPNSCAPCISPATAASTSSSGARTCRCRVRVPARCW
ncbi:MAG: hypothetical protein M5U09_10285 [Gammaproteobacteria bacterium]|nr:hypothetical protein [Gammaproteobacteria bacterium]